VTADDAHLDIVDWIGEATCRFSCPRCMEWLEKPVAPPLVRVLIQMGVRYHHPHALPAPPPPPLGPADLERFLRELATFDG
jgi:hypothetical protein